MDRYKDQTNSIFMAVEASMEELKGIRTSLYHNPEIGGQEFESSRLLKNSLLSHGFAVTENYYDFPTAFKAVYDTGKPGASIGIFAEYDALPQIGHGCGHNLICTMALGAAYGLQAVADQFGGKVIVYGTPGEENIQTKTIMAPKGAFKEADVAIMCHPNPVSTSSGTSRAIEALQIEFFGRTSHAGDCPENGINALDAAVMCYMMINQQKEYIPGSNIHGYIENGGTKASIIPDYTSLKYLTRADDMKTLSRLRELLDNCAQAAAKAIGCTYRMQNFEQTNAAMNTNRTMADVFDRYLELAGETYIDRNSKHTGSTDMADVSVLMPAIHPYVGLGDNTLFLHSTKVADCTITKAGDTALERGAKALACTGMEIMADPTLLATIRKEFETYQKDNQ